MRSFDEWVLSWLCAGLLLGGIPPEASRAEGHPVRARLLADVKAVEPGQALRLGVELDMEAGWHTYWAFSGDAGMPTEVEWELPPGFEAGPLQWPAPHKYGEEGGVIVYGYAGQTLLMARVRAPARLPAGPLRFGARVSWLVCRELCIPGDTTLTLHLPVGRAVPDHQELFGSYSARVPAPLSAQDRVALRHRVQRLGKGVQVDLELEGRGAALEVGAETPDFFPLGADEFSLRTSRRLAAAGGAHLRLQLEPYTEGKAIDTLRGVLVYRLAGEDSLRYGEVALDLKRAGEGGLLAMDFSAARGESPSLALYILFAALGGLILNLMPCVLPVISLKILSFVSQAGEERRRVRHLGFAFAAGIAVAFLALAAGVVALKAGGRQIGWGFQFQSPAFVMGMAALVFALGLSLFGVFTVNLPGARGNLGGLAEREGLAGSFFNGVLATILATPCTAPFLGAALGFAFAQSAGVVAAIFAATGAGMALPYILLALEPGWMRFLPRPGAWMERFRQFMGFLLMGTVLWLLWVLGKQLGVEAVIWTGAFLLALGLACWILGSWIDLRSSARRRLAAWGAAGAVVGFAYAAFLDPLLEAEKSLGNATADQGAQLAWQPFSLQRVEQLLAEDRHVFVDFTAEWCWTCKVNERTVLNDPEVRARFAALDLALVRADWTNRNAEITALLRRFGRSGVPLYVLFPRGHPERPIVFPTVITRSIVLEKLDEVAALDLQAGGP